MACYNILSVLVDSRNNEAQEIQKILTKNGCKIKNRLGIHDTSDDNCSESGLIILNVIGTDKEVESLESELNELIGVTAKNIKLCN